MLPVVKRESRSALIRAMYARTAAANARRRTHSGHIERILVIRPDHLGDLLFATPSLRLLREAFPNAHITGAAGPWGKPMWAGNPYLDDLVEIRFPGIAFRGEGGPLGSYRLLGRVASRIAPQHYDLAIALRFDHWWGAALMWAAGVPRRWGYNVPGTGLWLTNCTAYRPGRHEVEQDALLVEHLIASEAPGKKPEIVVDRDKGQPPLLAPEPVPLENEATGSWLAAPQRAIIHPGTGAANKLWTIRGWAEVIAYLSMQGWKIALTGSPGEKGLCDAIVARSARDGEIANLAGQTANLGQLGWLFERAGLVLGVDSGPLHMAAALNVPTLHLYGPSDERIWGPWGDPNLHRAFRAPGTRPSMLLDVLSHDLEGGPEMRAITPGMVLNEIRELERFTVGE